MQTVDLRLESVEIPTYVPGPPSPLPHCGWLGRFDVYPYSTMMDTSTTHRPMKHRVIVMENRYVRVEILPDMGGRVYRFYDKVARKDVFEFSPTMKFQNIAVRGAWVSGGIEFNFGQHGHTVNSISPVSWAMRNDPDGGASVWVGALIMPVESRWAVRISLKPDSSALETEIHLMGPPSLPGLAYWWSNSAVEVGNESRFYYYGLSATDSFGPHSWPICDGKDLQWYKNRFVGGDMFLRDCQRDYLGFYDFSRHHGVAQRADRFEAPGQKYFSWGTYEYGRFWDELLSDAGHTYCEVQRGRHPTQGDSDFIQAMTEDSWTEYWAPLNNTEGFSAFENDLILSVVNEEHGAAVIRLAASAEKKDLTLKAAHDGQALGAWNIKRVAPDAMFTTSVRLPAGASCNQVRVLDSDGRTALDWTEFQFKSDDWRETGHQDPLGGPETAEKLFVQAEKARFYNWPRNNEHALGLYDKILAMDQFHVGALQAKAEFALHRGENAKAIELVRKALPRAQYDADLLVILGWACLRSDRGPEAMEAFASAARSEPGRRRGLAGLACVHLQAGRFEEALRATGRILAWNPADKWGRLLRAVMLRKNGRRQEAADVLGRLLNEDPLWSAASAEALLLGVPANLGGGRRIADDTVSAAAFYIETAQWEDAAAILKIDESNEPFSPAVRLAHLLYVQNKLGDSPAAEMTLREICGAPAECAHPWTTVSIAVLEELVKFYPDKPALWVLLGNGLAGRSRTDEAKAAWERAVGLGMANAVLFCDLAAARRQDTDKTAALEYYRKALPLARNDLAIWTEVDRFLASVGRHEERLGIYDQLPQEARARSTVADRRVGQLLDNCRYDEAFDELSNRVFLRREFEGATRLYYMEAVAGKALPLISAKKYEAASAILLKGLEYPRNVNVGRRDHSPNEAMIHYMLGLNAEAAGDNAAAKEHWRRAATEPSFEGSIAESYSMLAWLALGDQHSALRLAHRIEHTAREARGSGPLFWYYYTQGFFALNHGLVYVFKGRLDLTREEWKKGIEADPACRFLRLHLQLSDDLLNRMSRKVTGKA